MSLAQLLAAKRNNNADVWPAQWFMGLTGKSVQNVLKSNPKELDEYLTRFNASQDVAIARAEDEFGKLDLARFILRFKFSKENQYITPFSIIRNIIPILFGVLIHER